MKLSICIPTYERYEMLFQSFEQVYDDPRIDEIVIVDDCSTDEIFEKIRKRSFELPKIKLYRNANNRDCYYNKYTALSFASNDWCILLDSDNIIDKTYLDALGFLDLRAFVDDVYALDKSVAYMPSFARPLFDYTHMAGWLITKENVASMMNIKMFDTMLNCMNYVVNRHEYIRVWQSDINPHTADSILQNYNWFAAGNSMLVVPHMQYFHRVHEGSHYQNNNHKTGGLYEEIIQKLKQLR